VIAAKLRHLENIPNIAGAGGFAKKHQRRAVTVSFEIDFNVVAFDERHERKFLPECLQSNYDGDLANAIDV
jgi:hypothetical protein